MTETSSRRTGSRRSAARLLAIFAALAMLTAACGSSSSSSDDAADDVTTDDESAETTAEPDSPETTEGEDSPETTEGEAAPLGELTASARGVTAETITVGISMLDFPFLVENNFSPAGWGDQELSWQTAIDDLNARGGINGRMVEAIYEFYSPIGETEAEQACLRLTEDNEVFAVLGGFLGPAEPANNCVANLNKTALIGGNATPELINDDTAPWVMSRATESGQLEAFAEALDESGRLDGATIAIVEGSTAPGRGDELEALLTDAGNEPILLTFNAAPSGDNVAEDTSWQVIAEQIRSSGADTVVIVGNTTGGIRNVVSNALEVEMWVTDNAALASLGDSIDRTDADGVITINGLTPEEEFAEPSMITDCVDVFVAANPDVEVIAPADRAAEDEDQFRSISTYCRWLKLFEILATAAGAELTNESLAEAIANAGEFSLPGMPNASLSADKVGANDSFQLAEFRADEGEAGGLVPLAG